MPRLPAQGSEEAKAGASLARTQLLPQVSFTEDISRGNDPVYVFGTKLRQQRFTQADFDLDSLNRPTSARKLCHAAFRIVAGVRLVPDAKDQFTART